MTVYYCETCRYFQEHERGAFEEHRYGHCHRYAPRPPLPWDGEWPAVDPTDWCGEYKVN